ncbi:PREDICTED: PRUPE_1G502200 [Prunus dulcis]|uniref:PREDICTED: PRUPE_1G502200 n=1 Tax=Prunus dulcis TaxID=3755 RepID=A0A5E4G485_PRUDU|nr:PREDICTED: PRUPE_1G502200 [Prunus dulcis]
MARGNGEGGRGISRGRGNIAQAPVYPNSQESVTRGNGQGVLPSSHIGLGRGLSSSKLSAIRGRGLGRGISGGRGLPSSRSTVGGKRKGTRRTSFGQYFP